MKSSIPLGTVVGGRWRLEGALGVGGFGEVFEALDVSEVSLGRAALKVLHPYTSPLERASFVNEVQKIAGMRHEHLVGYLDSGLLQIEADGEVRPFMVAELCEGSLADVLRDQPNGIIDHGLLLQVLSDMSAGLVYLHERGLIHRDIKPANVLFGGGKWKLADFGLMRDLSASGTYHRGETLVGTPAYMAPELFVAPAATRPSDIYAVGVLTHVCATGRTPFTGPALTTTDRDDRMIDPNLDPRLTEIVARATEPDPTRRPDAQQLAAVVAGGSWAPAGPPVDQIDAPPTAAVAGPPDRSPTGSVISLQPVGRAPGRTGSASSAFVAIMATVAVLAFGAAAVIWQMNRSSEEPTESSDGSTAEPLDETADSDSPTGPEPGQPVSSAPPDPNVALSPTFVPERWSDLSSHLTTNTCSLDTPMEAVNQLDVPVTYFFSIALQDASGADVGQTSEVAYAVAPGTTVMFVTAPFDDEGVVSCRAGLLWAFASRPGTAENADRADLIECVPIERRGYEFELEFTNPYDQPASARIQLALVTADGRQLDSAEHLVLSMPGSHELRVRDAVTFLALGLSPELLAELEPRCEIVGIEMSPPL